MKAIVYRDYGSTDVLRYEDIEKPSVSDDEVLIRIRAASVNPYDWHFMRGMPYAVRIVAGLRKPKVQRLGVDVAGEIESVGAKITKFKPGDAVFGTCPGSFAEYACAKQTAIALKPENATFEQAASLPVAALTALQGLRNKGKLRSGQNVLINGASGGVGTFAVQIAKSFGAHVTGVCSTRNVEMVRSIGADHVIDYTQEDFTKRERRYDLFFDLAGNHSLAASRRVLSPGGIYVGGGGPADRWMIGPISRLAGALVLSRLGSRKVVFLLTKANPEDLTVLCELMQAGKLRAVVDRRYTLSEVPEALRYSEEGHARGKVVINVGPPS